MEFSEKVRRLIERDGWASLRAIAIAAGVDDSTLDRATKSGRMSVDKAIKVAGALKVPVEWLFAPDRDWPPPPRIAAPPVAIYPWPPHGITWPEVRYAIAAYAAERAGAELRRGIKGEGVKAEADGDPPTISGTPRTPAQRKR